jgi:hypothetical protein
MTSRSPWKGKMFPPNQTPSDANLSLPHGLLMHGVAHPLMDIPSPVSACASDVSGRTKS